MISDIFISIVLLSIVGACVSSIFLASEKYIYKYTSSKFASSLNTLVIMTFIIPFYKIIFYADETTYLLKTGKLVVFTEAGTFKESIYTILGKSLIADYIIDIWFIGLILHATLTICYYCFWIKKAKKYNLLIEDKTWVDALNKLQKQENSCNAIELVSNSKIVQPCTTGISKKLIIIPEYLIDRLNSEEIELILSHELIHITRSDVQFKMFIAILNSLHWFNPLFYLLKHNLNDWTELSCDEDLSYNFTLEQRKAYVNLLFKLVEEGKKKQKYVLCFGGKEGKNLKRRIYRIMQKNKKDGLAVKLVISAMVFTVVLGSSAVTKAADLQVYSVLSENTEVTHVTKLIPIENEVVTEKEFDYPFVGTVKFVNEQETKHQHNYVDAKLQEHTKNKDGSCKTTIYNASRCTICNNYIKGDVDNTIVYQSCIH